MLKELSFRDASSQRESVFWLRSNLIVRNQIGSPVLELRIQGLDQQATLFVNPEDAYIMGFRGAHEICLLEDRNTPRFEQTMKREYPGEATRVLEGFSSRHGGTLQTIRRGGNRSFVLSDLRKITVLPRFVYKETSFAEIAEPLSLLICLTSESARIPIIGDLFTGMFYGSRVTANSSIQYYDDAKQIMGLAARLFPSDSVPDAVRRLEKRTSQLRLLKQRFAEGGDGKIVRNIEDQCSRTTQDGLTAAQKHQVSEFSDVCKQLKIKPDEVRGILTVCENSVAVEAAVRGVVVPEIPSRR